MASVLCLLYDDPVDGYPASYARDKVPDHRSPCCRQPLRRSPMEAQDGIRSVIDFG